MLKLRSHLLPMLLILASSLINGCGGGGGGAAESPPVAVELTPQSAVARSDAVAAFGVALADWSGGGGDAGDGGVGGSAGDGAPTKGAVIVVTDATGKSVTGLTDRNGNYVVTFSNFTRPLVGKVVDAGGNVLASVTNEAAAPGQIARMNINPLTDKIVSQVLTTTTVVLSGLSGTTTQVVPVGGTDKSYTGASINVAGLEAAKTEVLNSVSAALKTAGVSDASVAVFDPVRSVYQYDGKGVDAVIDSITHTRNPVTGATQLNAKLAPLATNPDGTVVPTVITSSSPLATSQVALNTHPTLTFDKLNAWVNEANRCLALAPSQTDVLCDSANRLYSVNYRHNSKDFEEDFRTLCSEPDRGCVQGSTVRNPVVLFISRYAGSTLDDLAVVEMTIRQPRSGPLAGNVSTPLEYTRILVFKRDDSLTNSAAGNWILHGNQRQYNATVSTRYVKSTQTNPARTANDANGAPSSYQSRLHISFSETVFDAASRTYVNNNVRAVRVTGPGLPATGVVLVPSSVIGAGSFAIFNKTGTVPTSIVATNTSANSFGLAALATDGSALAGTGAFNPAGVTNSAVPPDFSTLQAFARYRFEVFLNGNLTSTPDVVETAPNLAPVYGPSTLTSYAFNDVSPSTPLATAPAPSATSMLVQWQNNLNAAPVNRAQVVAQERNPKGATSNFTLVALDIGADVFAAYSLNNRPTSQLVVSTSPPFPSLALPAQAGDFRQIAIWSFQGRANVQNVLRWDN